jgi:hypothetical protein
VVRRAGGDSVRQKLIALALIVTVVLPASAFAAERPLLRDAIRHAASTTPLKQMGAPERHTNRYLWPGLIAIAGGATLSALAATAAKKETCAVVTDGYDFLGGCIEETNKPLMWVGIGAAAGGATMLALGSRHHQVAVGASSIRYRLKF